MSIKTSNMCSDNYWNCVLASILTIIQAGAHLGLTLYGLLIHGCKVSPKHLTFFLYITYFYDSKCGNLTKIYENTTLHQKEYYLPHCVLEVQPNKTTGQQGNSNETGKIVWKNSNIIKEMLVRVEFPIRSRRAEVVHDYLMAYLILDSLWIVTAIGLLIGVCMYVRDVLSVIFYFPWVLVAAAVIILDTITIFVFAIDIGRTDTASYWLRTVGAKNLENLTDLDWKVPGSVTTFPAVTMLLGASRLFLIYILNVFFFLAILSAAVAAYKESYYDDEGKMLVSFW